MSKRILFAFSALVAFLVAVFVVLEFRRPNAEELFQLPQPNGYDGLLQAAGNLSLPFRSFQGEPRSVPLNELDAVIPPNEDMLLKARKALQTEIAVPVELNLQHSQKHLPEIAQLKYLARAFVYTGIWHERHKRFDEAVRCYLDVIKLGNEIARGGLIIDLLVGLACQQMGITELNRLSPDLNASQRQLAIKRLETLEDNAVTLDAIRKREDAWVNHSYSIIARVHSMFAPTPNQRIEARYETIVQNRRNLQGNLGKTSSSIE